MFPRKESRLYYIKNHSILKIIFLDFPDGTVDRNMPGKAGDTGSILGLGRFHMPWSNSEELNLCTATSEPMC